MLQPSRRHFPFFPRSCGAGADVSQGRQCWFVDLYGCRRQFVFGSSKDLDCILAKTDGTAEHYTGTIKKYGVDFSVEMETGQVKPMSISNLFLSSIASMALPNLSSLCLL